MATGNIRLVDVIPTITGPAAAVTEVQEAMDRMEGRVEDFSTLFHDTFTELSNLIKDDIPASIPNLEFEDADIPQVAVPTPPSASIPDTLDMQAPDAPDMTPQLPVAPNLDWPTAPVIVTPDMPAAPAFAELAVPAKPVVGTDLTVPEAPSLNLPALPALDVIDVPAFTAPELPAFDESAPLFNSVAPNTVIQWTEPVYQSENFDESLAVLQRMRLGGTGLPAAVEQAIFERGRARIDRATSKAVAELSDQWAARGFVAPPGALSAQRAAVVEDAQLQVGTLSRDVLVQATETEIENLRFSVTQGLAAEQILVNLFSNAVQRTFEMARFTVETSLSVYNAQINVFNALMQAYQTKASVFKVLTDAALATLEQQRLQLEAARVRGELNQQKVAVYSEQVKATLSEVELYKARLQGVQAKADVVKTIFEGFRAEVQAYAEQMGARKTEADIFRTRMEGETAKIKVGEAQASIFSALVNSQATKASIWKDTAQVEIARVGAVAASFGHTIEGYKSEITRANAKVQAVLELGKTKLQAYSAHSTALIETARARQAVGELKLQTNVAKANTSVKYLELNLTKLGQQMDLRARSLQALGQMAATLTGGAMAAQHVTAGITSSSSEGVSYGKSETVANNLSQSLG